MNIFKRTWMSVTKRKGKTLIMLTVIFLIGNIIAGAVSINNATKQVEDSMKNQLGAKATVDMNVKLNQSGEIDPDTYKVFTADMAEELAKLSQVKDVKYSVNSNLRKEGIKLYSRDEDEDIDSSQKSSGNMSFTTFGGGDSVTILGAKGEVPEEISKEEISITEGTYPKAQDDKKELLISEKFAKLNNLKVGDTYTLNTYKIDFKDMNSEPDITNTSDQEFVISGLFKVNSKPNTTNDPMADFMEENQHNTMYTDYKTINEIDIENAKGMIDSDNPYRKDVESCRSMVTPIYELNSVDDIDSFIEDAKKIIDEDSFIIKTTRDEFDKVAGSILNMKDMSQVVLVFGIGASVLILTLVLFLFMRDRKSEFGIYQALGESKFKSTLQVLLEVLIITVVGVSLAFVSGNIAAKNISTNMIKNQMNQNELNNQNQDGMFVISIGGDFGNQLTDITEEEIAENFKVEVTSKSVVMFYSIMIGSAMIATGLSSIFILRLKPREILL